MATVNNIGGLDVRRFTNANLVAHKTIEINASAEKIWKTVSNHSALGKWMPMVKHVDVHETSASNANNGVGCERVCTFGSDKINEKVVHVEQNKIFAVQAAETPMFKNHLSVVEIVNKGQSKSEVGLYIFFNPKGMKGFMMKNLMIPMVFGKALKNLKKISSN